MKPQHDTTSHHPVLPFPLSIPLKLISTSIHSKALVLAMNRVFKENIKEGELDFLQDKIIHIKVDDAGINLQFTLNDGLFITNNEKQSADLVLNGNLYDYLLLASRTEDADALFFNRRLHMQGNTELGLYVKNFLDGLDMDADRIPAYLESMLRRSLPVYERLFS